MSIDLLTTPAEEAALAAAGVAVIFMVLLYGFLFLLLIAQYLLNAFAMLRIAKKVGLANGWMAFVPFADIYLLGQIADVNSQKKVNTKRLLITYIVFFAATLIYVFGAFVYGVSMGMGEGITLGVLLFVGTALLFSAAAICYSVFAYIAYYRICENFGEKNAIGWFLGILLGGMLCSSLVPVILLLILSGKTPAVTVAGSTVVTPPTPPVPPAPPTDDVFTA